MIARWGRRRERELDAIRTGLRAATDHAEKRQREAKRLGVLLEEAREEHTRFARLYLSVIAVK